MGELLPGVEDVGEEEGETAVVVQPVNINRVAQRILVQENSPLKWLKHDMDPCSHSSKDVVIFIIYLQPGLFAPPPDHVHDCSV